MSKSFYLFIIYIALLFMHASVIVAQDTGDIRQIYSKAENEYQIGRVDQALDLLQTNLPHFDGMLRQSAYRLMALCHLALDDNDEAENCIRQLLTENPFYSTLQDPARLSDMVNSLKSGQTARITTASNQVERIEEAPVPVTIITREMIDRLSYNKTINNILAVYVPGFSEVSTATMDNLSVHGVFTSGQEKILIMENGHRLNARSTNTGKLDYSISTEKIDHIEVLRGPASSLYGNVALTAVVNIITRKGVDVNGLKVKYGYGQNQTHRADVLFGNTFIGTDVLVWGNIFTSEGKSVFSPKGTGFSNSLHDGTVFIGRYDGKPSYDWGAQLRMNDFGVMLSRKYSKQVPQYSLYGESYDFERYRSIDGQTPGLSVGATHMELSYKKQLGRINLDLSVNGDWYNFADYSVLSDSIIFTRYNTDGTPAKNPDGTSIREIQKGLYQKTDWDERSIGITCRLSMPYQFANMKGDLMLGVQHESFSLTNTDYYLGENYDQVELVMPESLNAIDVGKEHSLSFFLQAKHYLSKTIIANIGIRYDKKYRKNDKIIDAVSPRIAFIYTPKPAFNVKLSYSRAFVDAPYFYRQNKTNTYSGGENLMPEYMNALQLDFMGNLANNHLAYDVNLFYNRLTDIINNTQKVGEHTSAKYRNSGLLTMCGAEAVLSYYNNTFNARLSSTYQYVISSEDYYVEQGSIYAVPSFMTNLSLSEQLFTIGNHSLTAMANVSYSSRTFNRIGERYNPVESTFYFDGRFLVDMGLKYHFKNFLQVSVDIENLFNKTYYVGGTTHFPYQRLGRVAMATLSFNL